MQAHAPIAEALRRHGLATDAPMIDALARAWAARWPALASRPGGELPLIVGLRDWWLRDPAHAPLMVRDPELEAIVAGDRVACLKEGIPADFAPALVDAYRAMGFAAGIAHRHGLRTGEDRHVDDDSRAIVAVARDAASLDETIATFAAHSGPGRREAVHRMAGLLGYPACCAAVFAATGERADNLELERGVLERAPDAALHPLLQRLGRCRLISHFPCRADCAESVALATRAFDRLAAIEAGLGDQLLRELARPVLFLDYERRALLQLDDRPEGPYVVDAEPLGEWPALASFHGWLHELDVGRACLARPGKSYRQISTHKEQNRAPDLETRFERLFPPAPDDIAVTSMRLAGGRIELSLATGRGNVAAYLELDPAGRTFARAGRLGVSYPSEQSAPNESVLAAIRALAKRIERAGEIDPQPLFQA